MKKEELTRANEITAKACDVDVTDFNPCEDEWVLFWEHKNIVHQGEWTIEDPRCREIVREHYKIDTCHYENYDNNTWHIICTSRINAKQGQGESIAEAETKCILAICEVQNES